MQIFALLLRSFALLALSTGSSGQSVPAGTLEEIRGELLELRVEWADENAALRHELEENNKMLENMENKNTALHLELEDIRDLLQTQPRRTFENNVLNCMSQDQVSGDIIFDGCNVHIRSGEGNTWATTNGKGNLIIGYNESPNQVSDGRGGSHNLIIGPRHEYSSYGGIVTGVGNQITNEHNSVVGGEKNRASGYASSIFGGLLNNNTGYLSSISGGIYNTASGSYSSISGGASNTASGYKSSISGGESNTASGESSSISGGYVNKASGKSSSVLGGKANKAEGKESVVSGGWNNKAIGELASVLGGKKNIAKRKLALSVATGE